MVILGLDPGTTRVGYGFIKKAKNPILLSCGLLKIKSRGDSERILEAVRDLRSLIKKHKPGLVAIEKLFFVKNQKTGIAVAQLRGAMLFTAAEAEIPTMELAPTEIKKAVAGFGAADKKAVQKMVCLSLNIPRIPGPDDVSDALATSLAAFFLSRHQIS